MNILVTAFKGEHNSSYQLIKNVNADKLLFTNSFDGIDKNIDDFDFYPYSAAIMFGLDPKLTDSVRIENCARLGERTLMTAWDTGAFSEMLEMYGVPNKVSRRATAYLCNYAYYQVLELMYGRAIFIHIPPEKHLTEDLKNGVLRAVQAMF